MYLSDYVKNLCGDESLVIDRGASLEANRFAQLMKNAVSEADSQFFLFMSDADERNDHCLMGRLLSKRMCDQASWERSCTK